MKSAIFLAVFLFVFVATASSRFVSKGNYELDGGSNPRCFNVVCPSQTNGCKRIMKTSDDHSKLITIIECQDDNMQVLDTQRKEEANRFDKSVQFYSLSYSGTVTKGNFDNKNDIYRNFGSKLDNDVETF